LLLRHALSYPASSDANDFPAAQSSTAGGHGIPQRASAGAAGYVLKQIRGTDLVGAVRTVASDAGSPGD
jgi:DNA-binding NarL/FixJ family response regulator